MAAKKAVRVLPDPVGAATRVGRPLRINGQARCCASVALVKVRRNQAATAGWKSSQVSLAAGHGVVMKYYMRAGARTTIRRWSRSFLTVKATVKPSVDYHEIL